MAWDFSTDPEFQEHLDWMNAFVREEIWPLEPLGLSYLQIRQAMAPLQQRASQMAVSSTLIACGRRGQRSDSATSFTVCSASRAPACHRSGNAPLSMVARSKPPARSRKL